jgi:alkylhydroperoxidase family enzyme
MPAMSSHVRIDVVDSPSLEARRLMEDARAAGSPNPDAYLVFDHCPELMRTFHEHWRAIFDNGNVDRELKELVRRRIAELVNCATCRAVDVAEDPASIEAKLDAACRWEDSPGLSERERGAMWLVDAISGNDERFDELYRFLNEHFDEAEIVELGWFAGLNLGTVPFIRSWGLHDELAPARR